MYTVERKGVPTFEASASNAVTANRQPSARSDVEHSGNGSDVATIIGIQHFDGGKSRTTDEYRASIAISVNEVDGAGSQSRALAIALGFKNEHLPVLACAIGEGDGTLNLERLRFFANIKKKFSFGTDVEFLFEFVKWAQADANNRGMTMADLNHAIDRECSQAAVLFNKARQPFTAECDPAQLFEQGADPELLAAWSAKVCGRLELYRLATLYNRAGVPLPAGGQAGELFVQGVNGEFLSEYLDDPGFDELALALLALSYNDAEIPLPAGPKTVQLFRHGADGSVVADLLDNGSCGELGVVLLAVQYNFLQIPLLHHTLVPDTHRHCTVDNAQGEPLCLTGSSNAMLLNVTYMTGSGAQKCVLKFVRGRPILANICASRLDKFLGFGVIVPTVVGESGAGDLAVAMNRVEGKQGYGRVAKAAFPQLCQALTRLQFLDIIGGNADRFPSNFFFEVQGDNFKHLTGIDNDDFGCADFRNRQEMLHDGLTEYGAGVPPFVDSDMVDAIEGLDKDVLDDLFYGLNASEAHERLGIVRDYFAYLRETDPRRIISPGGWPGAAEELAGYETDWIDLPVSKEIHASQTLRLCRGSPARLFTVE